MFLAALDQMIVVIALPTIAIDLGGLNLLSWVVSIYLLTASAFSPLWGRFSDVWGRRWVYLCTILLFVAGSIICALAPNLNTLVAGRAVQVFDTQIHTSSHT